MQTIDSQVLKNNLSNHRLSFATCIIFLLTFCIFLSSCDEPKTGCLDIAATNFAADADDPCEDCCTFPTLKIQFLHRITQGDTTLNLQYDSAYTINGTDFFRIKNIRYILSDLEFVRADGSAVTVLDTVELTIPNAPGDTTLKTRPDNFVVVEADNFQAITVANYRESGNFVGLQFNIGIPEPDNQAIPTSLVDDHPLNSDSLYLGTGLGYIFNEFSFVRDTTPTTKCELVQINGESQLKTISLDTTFTARESFDVQVILAVDYAEWLTTVDISNHSTTKIAEEITTNINKSFTLFDIIVE